MGHDKIFLTFKLMTCILSTLVWTNFSTFAHTDYLVPICTIKHARGAPRVLPYCIRHLVCIDPTYILPYCGVAPCKPRPSLVWNVTTYPKRCHELSLCHTIYLQGKQ